MVTLEILEQGELVSGDTSTVAIAYFLFEDLDFPAPHAAIVFPALPGNTQLLYGQKRCEVAAIEGADTPGRRRGVRLEDLPGNVGRDHLGGLVQIARDQRLGRDASSRLRVLEIDRHLPGFFKPVPGALQVDGLNPDPDLVTAWVRPQHSDKADDRAGEAAYG